MSSVYRPDVVLQALTQTVTDVLLSESDSSVKVDDLSSDVIFPPLAKNNKYNVSKPRHDTCLFQNGHMFTPENLYIMNDELLGIRDIATSHQQKLFLDQLIKMFGLDVTLILPVLVAFYIRNGTSHDLSNHKSFKVQNVDVFHADIVGICSSLGLSVRKLLRGYADLARQILRQNPSLSSILYEILAIPDKFRVIAFDFSDGCCSPSLTTHELNILSMIIITGHDFEGTYILEKVTAYSSHVNQTLLQAKKKKVRPYVKKVQPKPKNGPYDIVMEKTIDVDNYRKT